MLGFDIFAPQVWTPLATSSLTLNQTIPVSSLPLWMNCYRMMVNTYWYQRLEALYAPHIIYQWSWNLCPSVTQFPPHASTSTSEARFRGDFWPILTTPNDTWIYILIRHRALWLNEGPMRTVPFKWELCFPHDHLNHHFHLRS